MYSNLDFPEVCPYCKKDLRVYNIAGARKHVHRCSRQKTPTYIYRDHPRGRPKG